MFQNPKCMHLSQSLLFDKYTYSFFICRPSIRILKLLWIMCNQVAVRLDLVQSSLYDSTTIVIGIVYPQRAITSDRQVPAFSRFRPVDMQLIQCLRLDTVLNRDETDCQRRAIFSGRSRRLRRSAAAGFITHNRRLDME